MDKLEGKNRPLQEQIKILETILFKNKTLKNVLLKLQETSIVDYNYYVGAGAINQTVFNYYHNYPIDKGIEDFDIVYFDNDTSYEKEDKIIKEIETKLKDLNISCDIKNQARVHIWYNKKYNTNYKKEYENTEDAISKWNTTITCIGVRMENNHLIVHAPYGLDDLFKLIIRPQKYEVSKELYDKKCQKWLKKWPNLKIIPWEY